MTGFEWLPVVDAAALALAAAAGTSVWNDARGALVALLRRQGRDPRDTEELLSADERRLAEVAEPEREALRVQLAQEWRVRLTDLLRQHPAAAEELQAWSAGLQNRLPEAAQRNLQHIVASAPGATAQGVMFGSIVNHHHQPPLSRPPLSRPPAE